MRRRLFYASLYMSEGAPIGYIWWYLPTRLRVEGVSVGDIGALTALLVLPWTLKFLWAPVVDLFARRGVPVRWWIVGAQAVMGLTLLPLLAVDGTAPLGFLRLVLVCHAFAAATQDVAIDTLAIRSTPAGELGAINGWMQAGMLLGRSLFGGVALFLRGRVGDDAIVIALIALIWINLAVVWRAREDASVAPPESASSGSRAISSALPDRRGVGDSFARILAAAARRPGTWFGLLFAALSGAAFEGIGAVAGPFLVDRGMGEASIGAFLAGPAVIAMLAGSLLGGVVSDRAGRARAAGWFLAGICAAAFGLSAVASSGSTGMLLTGLGVLYLGIGCFTASSYALFMGLTDRSMGATQFSAYMAATNGCESWASFATGSLAQSQGYGRAFAAMAVASVLAIPLLGPIARELRKGAAWRDRSGDRARPDLPDRPPLR
jgi:MFS transporter (putative signal transducer)